MNHRSSWLFQGVSVLIIAALAGCTTTSQAPVENRGGGKGLPAPTTTVASTAARPGYHIVKRGETLYSIALEYGQDYRDVASWNGIDNPSVIATGQELRVIPPGSSAGATPVTGPSIDVRPMEGKHVETANVPANTATLKSEPKGGRLAYSPQTWNDLVVAGSNVTETAKPATSGEPKASTPTPAVGNDSVDWMWPAAGKVVAGFNEATNKGLDIGGSVGDPVLAASSGKVVYVGSGLRGYGNLVIVKHNNNFLSAYAHNSQILVKEGQPVTKGQKIATMGDSDADRAKLHFEIRRQGKPVDPSRYLPVR